VSERDPGAADYGQPLGDVAEDLAEQRRAITERQRRLDGSVAERFEERGDEGGEEERGS
jgi:hypothetical protein